MGAKTNGLNFGQLSCKHCTNACEAAVVFETDLARLYSSVINVHGFMCATDLQVDNLPAVLGC